MPVQHRDWPRARPACRYAHEPTVMLAVDGCLCLSMSPALCAQDTPTLSSPPRSRQCCRSAPQPASTGSCCCGTTRRSPSGRLAATQRWAPGQTASLACHQAAAQLSGGVRPGGGQARLSSQRAHRLDRVPGWRRPRMGRQIRCCIDTLCAGLTQSGRCMPGHRMRAGACLQTWTGHQRGIQDLALSGGGWSVVTGSDDATARVFALAAMQVK